MDWKITRSGVGSVIIFFGLVGTIMSEGNMEKLVAGIILFVLGFIVKYFPKVKFKDSKKKKSK